MTGSDKRFIPKRRIASFTIAFTDAVNFVDSFKAPEPGYIGGFFNNKLFFYSTPAQSVCESEGDHR